MSTARTDRRQALQQALADYTPADAQEAEHLARMQALLTACGDPFDRHHFSPGHFTASAFVLSADRSALLLILHGKLGLWLQPGGHIEPDDAGVVEAATREALEETGLRSIERVQDAPFDLDVHDLPPYGGNPAHAHFDVRYLFTADDSTAVAGSDARDVRYFPLAELSQTHSDRSVMRAVDKLRGR